MPLGHLIALIINIHPLESDGLPCQTAEKMNIEQKDQIFFQNLPGTGSVRPAPKTGKPKLSMDPFHPFTR